MPDQESSHVRSAQSARSLEGSEHQAKPDGSTEEAGAGTGHREATRTVASLSGHELMVRAFRYVIPRAHQRLDLREGRVDLPSHRRLLGLLLDNLDRELFEVAQHRNGHRENLDLAFELRLEPV